MKVYTESVQFKADQKLLDFIDKKIGKLEQYFDRIVESRVVLKLENSGQIKDKIAEVAVSVPGETLFAKSTSKTFESAINDVSDSLRRQLVRYKDKLRGRST
ncbi:MAG: ribosome-associated translation inhibitor RaiA [Saprospiraceae bacterium]|nr:ribosome-associated translation inhibitor RaiA [Saprospiraceae bacterium]